MQSQATKCTFYVIKFFSSTGEVCQQSIPDKNRDIWNLQWWGCEKGADHSTRWSMEDSMVYKLCPKNSDVQGVLATITGVCRLSFKMFLRAAVVELLSFWLAEPGFDSQFRHLREIGYLLLSPNHNMAVKVVKIAKSWKQPKSNWFSKKILWHSEQIQVLYYQCYSSFNRNSDFLIRRVHHLKSNRISIASNI